MPIDYDHMEFSEDNVRSRAALDENLRKRSGSSKPMNTFLCELLELADMILKLYYPKKPLI